MGHMLDLAIVDKLNRAGFVVAPYNTPVEVPNMPRNARFDCAAKSIVRRTRRRRSARRKHRPPATLRVNLPVSSRALCGPRRSPESGRVSTAFLMGLRRQHIEDR